MSRKNPPPKPDLPAVNALYRGAAYRRLSVEDARHRDRHTLENQKNIIMDFLERQPDIRLVDIYTDDGESGTSFDRSGFIRLMDDVRAGKINCIIVKDLSRFARDFREAGQYLEQIFPFLGVRFISVNDNYDTAHPRLDSGGIAIPAANLINEMYARDISQKVSSGLTVLRSQGKFLGSLAPYGYNKSCEDKHRLVIDPPAAKVVQSIFQWLLDGWSDYKIVKQLNQTGILSPGRYRFEQGILKSKKYADSPLWNRKVIKKLAQNPVYAGDMVQGRQDASCFSLQRGPKPEEKWTVVRNTHAPIVSRETFEAVQRLLAERKLMRGITGEHTAGKPCTENIMRGLLFCADCGRPLERRRSRSEKTHQGSLLFQFYCPTYTDTASSACTPKATSEHDVIEAVISTIQVQMAAAADLENVSERVRHSKDYRERLDRIDAEAALLRRKITCCGTRKRSLCENYLETTLPECEYLFSKEQYEREALSLERQLKKLLRHKEALSEQLSHPGKWMGEFLKGAKELPRPILPVLVERIDVYDGNRLAVTLKFTDDSRAFVKRQNEAAAGEEAVSI